MKESAGGGEKGRAPLNASLDKHSTSRRLGHRFRSAVPATSPPPSPASSRPASSPVQRPEPRPRRAEASASAPRRASRRDPTWRLGPAGRSHLLEAEREESGYTRPRSPDRPPRSSPLLPPHLRGVVVRGRLGDEQRQPPSGHPVELVDPPVEHPLPHCRNTGTGEERAAAAAGVASRPPPPLRPKGGQRPLAPPQPAPPQPSPRPRPLTLGVGEADEDVPGGGGGPQLALAAARALLALEVAEQLLLQGGRRLGGAPVAAHQQREGARPRPRHGCLYVPAAFRFRFPAREAAEAGEEGGRRAVRRDRAPAPAAYRDTPAPGRLLLTHPQAAGCPAPPAAASHLRPHAPLPAKRPCGTQSCRGRSPHGTKCRLPPRAGSWKPVALPDQQGRPCSPPPPPLPFGYNKLAWRSGVLLTQRPHRAPCSRFLRRA